MLAKIWKKVLLAICIIACIFNIMSKFVNKSSIESSLKNVKGDSIFSILSQDKQESNTVDEATSGETPNVVSNETTEEPVVNAETDATNEIVENTTSDYVVLN